jgi:hypothetical protein
MRNMIFTAGFLAATAVTTGAFAQDPPPAGGTASTNANVGVSLPGAAPAVATAGGSDHDQMVGRLAVGYFGISQFGAGAAVAGGVVGPAANASPYSQTGAGPIIGVRYWIDPMLGIDAGIGLGLVGGGDSVEVTGTPMNPPTVERDRDSFFGIGVHAGVPLSLASTGHFSWQIVPELNFLYASATTDPNGADDPTTPAVEGEGDQSHSGIHFDIGARAGAEIHFGFMGIPQLSLQGSVGLLFALDSGSTTDTTAPPAEVTASASRTSFGTTVGSAPWAIFTNNIAALYYF